MKITKIEVKAMNLGLTTPSKKRTNTKIMTGEVYFEESNEFNTFVIEEDIKNYKGNGIGVGFFIIITTGHYYIFSEDCKLIHTLSTEIGNLVQMDDDGFIVMKEKHISKYDNTGKFVVSRELTEEELQQL